MSSEVEKKTLTSIQSIEHLFDRISLCMSGYNGKSRHRYTGTERWNIHYMQTFGCTVSAEEPEDVRGQ